MRDWIVGLGKAATERRDGAAADELADFEARAGRDMPDELRDLYTEMNGAGFSSGVQLYPLFAPDGGPSVDAVNRELPDRWEFGTTSGDQRLFAARKRAITERAGGSPLPDWMDTVEDDAWVYGSENPETQETKLYRNLERLLAVLVPPAQTEEFGDITYARAMTAVKGAIANIIEPDADEDIEDDIASTPAVAARPRLRAVAGGKKGKAKPAAKKKLKLVAKAKPKAKAKTKPKAKGKARSQPKPKRRAPARKPAKKARRR